VRTDLGGLGLPAHSLPIPVFALKLGSKERMHRLHEMLYAQGLFIPLVEYPDQQGAYLRLALSAAHTQSDLDQLRDGLHNALLSCP
jgi:7-keto-8-aminopelargonate synthetase-like enzyme